MLPASQAPRRSLVAVPCKPMPYGGPARALLLALALIVAQVPQVALAAERAEAYLFVLEPIDQGGIVVPMVVPVAQPRLADAGPSSRAGKAFEALRARSPKAYGNTALQINSATKATLVLDKVADADVVLAETFWSLAAIGVTELTAPPYFPTAVTADKLSYGAHLQVLPVWDVLRFHDQPQLLAQAFVQAGPQMTPAADAVKRLAKGDPALRKILTDAVAGTALRPKLAVLDAIATGATRDAFKLKADDAVPALADGSLAVRGAALDAVMAAGLQPGSKALTALENLVENDTDAELKLRAVKALSKAGVTKYADLLESEKLKTGTAKEALEAVQKLSKSAQVKIAAPALVGALTHSDAAVREAAFQGLVQMKQFDLLFQAMDGDQLSPKMREQIAVALVENGSAAAQDKSLEYLLTKGSPQGAILAAQTYAKRGSRTAVPMLIDALKHDSAEVRGAAAQALAALKDPRAITPLADAADAKPRDKETMMKAAVDILATLGLNDVKTLAASKNLAVRQMAIRALAEFSKGSPRPDVVAILQDARKDADPNIKRAAVFALARIPDDGLARDLAAGHAKDPDAEIRLQVAVALASATPRFTEAAGMLEEMMNDTDKQVRIAAIEGVAKRKHVAAVPKLVQFVKQPDPEVKRAVYAALLALQDGSNAKELRPVFQKCMDTQNSAVRLVCIQALSEKTTAADFDALRQAAFDKSKQVQLAAVAALGSSKLPEAFDALANFFGAEDMEVREKALEALCAIPGGDMAKQKKQYLRDFSEAPDMPEALKKKANACGTP